MAKKFGSVAWRGEARGLEVVIERMPGGEHAVWKRDAIYDSLDDAMRSVQAGLPSKKRWWNREHTAHETMRARGEDDEPDEDLQIPGWSSGWDDEISAHAAVSYLGNDKLVMTAGEYDSAPRHLNDEVVVGLYRDDGEGGWDQIGYADFDSVHDVLALSKAELKRKLTEDSSLGEGRARERALRARAREAPVRRGGPSKYRSRPR